MCRGVRQAASSDVLRDPGGTSTGDNGTHQQENPKCGLMVCPSSFQRPLHDVEFSFELLLLWHKTARAGPDQLQPPNRGEEGLRSYVDEVEQATLHDGDAFVPNLPALLVDGSETGPLMGSV